MVNSDSLSQLCCTKYPGTHISAHAQIISNPRDKKIPHLHFLPIQNTIVFYHAVFTGDMTTRNRQMDPCKFCQNSWERSFTMQTR